ncbi:MAG: hypothetical protein JWQ40_2851 [Segetibacter sp.]|jgi:hypothetical protein|nr:hypothetical protein [Segetibacter sp.]
MNKEKLQQLGHLLAGLIVMIHGFDSFESGDYKPAAGYLGVAVLFMLLAGWHKSITQQFLQGDVAFFLLEAVIMFYAAWDYSNKGHTVMFFGMAIAGAVFVIFALVSILLNNDMPSRNKSRRKKRRRSSPSGLRDETRGDRSSTRGESSHQRRERPE